VNQATSVHKSTVPHTKKCRLGVERLPRGGGGGGGAGGGGEDSYSMILYSLGVESRRGGTAKVDVNIHVCRCICIYIHVYIYIERERAR
jgi:hypothetical protein